jgi:CRISPR-associated protein Cmr4
MNKNQMFWIHALSSLHIGTGRGLGFIDNPVMREKTTNWPFAPGSAVKGVMRDFYEQKEEFSKSYVNLAFGQGGSSQTELAGSLVFSDARLVLLPVRSLAGTFAYATSAMALLRLSQDLKQTGITGVPQVSNNQLAARVPDDSSALKAFDGNAYLEDLDFPIESSSEVSAWANLLAKNIFQSEWRDVFVKRFVILPDDSFNFFSKTALEVVARIRIEPETKIVASGALWYEENLPAETVLAGMVWCDRIFADKEKEAPNEVQLLDAICPASGVLNLQLGGKAATGKGRVRFVFSGKEVG